MSLAEEFKLSNGVTLVYEYTPHTKITSVQAWIKTGSVNEDLKNNGISHFLEHILFKGTKNYKPDEIDVVVESHGGIMNAGTSKDYTTYYITLPSEHVEVAYKVISDMVFNASFIKEEIEKEKPVVVQEIQRKYDNPTHDMWKDAIAKVFEGTPYAMEIIGTEENVNAFTREQLLDYYKSHYHPFNTTLVVVGDIPLKSAKTLAEKFFSVENKAKASKGYNEKWTPKLKKSEKKVYEKEVFQDYVLLVYPVADTLKDAPVYEVLSQILSGGELSLLNNELKYSKRLVTYIYAGELLNKSSGAYIVNMVTAPGESEKAVAEFQKTIKTVIDGKISEEDLQKAKNIIKFRIILEKEKASSEASEIGYFYTLDLKDQKKTYVEMVDKVQLKDISKLANTIFNSPHIEYKTVPDIEKK